MKKIAITGVIASGKSEVCKIIEDFGGYVIYTDKINSDLLNDKEYQKKLAVIFSDCVQNGVVNKARIRRIILNDDSKRLALNSLAHAEIARRVENIVEKFNGKVIFCEIPLIVESNMQSFFDEIWCVTASLDTKIKRIMTRDNVSKEDAEKIIALQKNDEQLIAISNVIINNDGNVNKLKEQISELLCTMTK